MAAWKLIIDTIKPVTLLLMYSFYGHGRLEQAAPEKLSSGNNVNHMGSSPRTSPFFFFGLWTPNSSSDASNIVRSPFALEAAYLWDVVKSPNQTAGLPRELGFPAMFFSTLMIPLVRIDIKFSTYVPWSASLCSWHRGLQVKPLIGMRDQP